MLSENRRGRIGANSVASLEKQGGASPPGRLGRGLLASSHAGTRLPIAVYKVQGAPPPPAADCPRGRFHHPFQKRAKTETPARRPRKNHSYDFPTAALSASGHGSKLNDFLSACFTSSPFFCMGLISSLLYRGTTKIASPRRVSPPGAPRIPAGKRAAFRPPAPSRAALPPHTPLPPPCRRGGFPRPARLSKRAAAP